MNGSPKSRNIAACAFLNFSGFKSVFVISVDGRLNHRTKDAFS